MKSYLLNADGGVLCTFNVSDDGEHVTISHTADAQPIFDDNHRAQSEGINRKAEMRHAARVDAVTHMRWAKEFEQIHGVAYAQAPVEERQAFIARKLNDRDNSKFRRWSGRLSGKEGL